MVDGGAKLYFEQVYYIRIDFKTILYKFIMFYRKDWVLEG